MALQNDPLWTVKEVAARLKVSSKTVRRLTERGELPVLRVGHSIRYDPAEVRSWLYEVPEASLSHDGFGREQEEAAGSAHLPPAAPPLKDWELP